MADQTDNVVRRPDRPKVQNPKMSAAPGMGGGPDDGEEMGFFKTLGRLLMKHNKGDEGDAQEHAQGGLTRRRALDKAVDEAVSGAKDDEY